jgi:hypothetical protein
MAKNSPIALLVLSFSVLSGALADEFMPAPTNADEERRQPANEVFGAQGATVRPTKMDHLFDAASPRCVDLTDGTCNKIWDPKNRGILEVSDGKISVGRSKKSEIKQMKLDDIGALLASEGRLPEDLKQKAKPVLAEFRKILIKERASKDWYRELSMVQHKCLPMHLTQVRCQMQYG